MKKLTSKMMRAAEIAVANPEKPVSEIAQELGVDTSTLWRWTKDDKYKEYQHELCVERFKDLEKLAIKKLKENAMNNQQKAIEYILDYVGYKPKDEIDISSGDINITIGDADD